MSRVRFSDHLKFGSAVAETRRAKGVTQTDLATRLRVKPARICAIERGRSVPANQSAADEIASALSCSEAQRASLLRALAYDRLMRAVRATFRRDYQVEMLSVMITAAQELGEQQSRTIISSLSDVVQPAMKWNRLATKEETIV